MRESKTDRCHDGEGLVDEVAGILKMGYSRDLVSLQAIGYKEIVAAVFAGMQYGGSG